MTIDEAVELLTNQEVVAVMQGSMSYMVELREKCLSEDIPVAVDRPRTGGKS